MAGMQAHFTELLNFPRFITTTRRKTENMIKHFRIMDMLQNLGNQTQFQERKRDGE